jgi:hypothetical protein
VRVISQCNYNDQIKTDDMGGECRKMGESRKA